MKEEDTHWAKKLYLYAEYPAKALTLVAVVVAPIYSLYTGDRSKFTFLNGFSEQMQSFSTLAKTVNLFTDINNYPIISNSAALVSLLGGLAKGAYVFIETVPLLQNADYSALFSGAASFATAISPVYLFIAATAIGVCAINYWMNKDEKAPSAPHQTTEPNVTDVRNLFTPGNTFEMTTPDGTRIKVEVSVLEAAISASLASQVNNSVEMQIV